VEKGKVEVTDTDVEASIQASCRRGSIFL